MSRIALSKEKLIRLSIRDNFGSALRLFVHVLLLIGLGFAAHVIVHGSSWWLATPVFLLYGMVFTFLGYAGLGHELQHGSVFGSKAVNEGLFWLVSGLTWNNPVYFRASHRVHHRHTLKAGVDFEVSPLPSPELMAWWRYAFLDWDAMWRVAKIFSRNAAGHADGVFAERHFPRGSQNARRLFSAARWILGLQLLLAGVGVWLVGPDWLLLITFAPFVCTLPNRCLAKLQHVGMAADVGDFRMNTRTIELPAWIAFLYWNMHFHIEHHMYPNVPYSSLPELRSLLKESMPRAPSTWREFQWLISGRLLDRRPSDGGPVGS